MQQLPTAASQARADVREAVAWCRRRATGAGKAGDDRDDRCEAERCSTSVVV
jgi:hypothetical protein